MCRFEIRALTDSQTLPRLCDYFAQRGLIPAFVQAAVDGTSIVVLIELPLLDPTVAELIAERMRSSVLVENVVMQIAA